jgi:uncharacterized protein (TIGR02271 family)
MTPTSPASSPSANDDDRSTVVLPVHAEQLEVSKRIDVSGTLRVRIEVDREPQAFAADRLLHEVDIERVVRNEAVSAARAPWHEGETLVVPVYEETVVVERRLVLKEELHIVPRTRSQAVTGQVDLRRERAVIERQQADGSWQEVEADGSTPRSIERNES